MATIFLFDDGSNDRLGTTCSAINRVGHRIWQATGRKQIGPNCAEHGGNSECTDTTYDSIRNESAAANWKLVVVHISNNCWKTPLSALPGTLCLLISGGTDEPNLTEEEEMRSFRCPFPWEPSRYSISSWRTFLDRLGDPAALTKEKIENACFALVAEEILTAALQRIFWCALPERIRQDSAAKGTASGRLCSEARATLENPLPYGEKPTSIKLIGIVNSSERTKSVGWPQPDGTEKTFAECSENEAQMIPRPRSGFCLPWSSRLETYLRRLRDAVVNDVKSL